MSQQNTNNNNNNNNNENTLFSPINLGDLSLGHRIVLAPLTRNRATLDNQATSRHIEYYRQRASNGGLLITEATIISNLGQAYPLVPGLFTQAQVDSWKPVTAAVHEKKGLIVNQLWHTGRVAHSSYSNSSYIVAPSAVAPTSGQAITYKGSVDYEVPHALTVEEIKTIVNEYRVAAKNALAAGFDGVELHGANGYLIEQFLSPKSNIRTDQYGGSAENRARFLFEVLDAVIQEVPSGRVGVRLSPGGTFGDMFDANPRETFGHVVSQLNNYKLAYVHLIEPREPQFTPVADGSHSELLHELSSLSKNAVIYAGGFERAHASQVIETGVAQGVAFGRHFIANPDLPLRLLLDAPLNPYDRSTFYGGNETGYTDYPALTTVEISDLLSSKTEEQEFKSHPLVAQVVRV